MQNYNGTEIAIIGMSGRFPGASNIGDFWKNLRDGKESISVLSEEELLAEGVERHILDDPSYVRANSYIIDKEYFDADFFRFLPEEAKLMDPQIRIFLESCWSALEDAGCNLEQNEEKIGLFAGGASNVNWEVYSTLVNKGDYVDNYTADHLTQINYLCSTVSYHLNLQGPTVYVNTACSTSLVAVQRASMSLLLNECKMALAGGIRINNFSKNGYLYQEGMIKSKDGHCRAFDADSSGTVGGEGVGVVVLKRLKDALQDGDVIHAVIRGSAVNNDGSDKMSFTAPSVDGQHKAILKAIKMAGIPPQSIGYIEAHGTGTALGDPIEVQALNLTLGESKEKYCALGSVKTNIGHLDAAAGVAGLIKTVLSLKHGQIPPSLHFKKPNPKIDFARGPLYVNAKLQEWKSDTHPLRAGVSSFGIGGTNVHVVLEKAPEQVVSSEGRDYQMLLVSGKTSDALSRNLKNLREYLNKNDNEKLEDIAYTLQLGRTPFKYRKSLVCKDIAEAVDGLSTENLLGRPISVSDKSRPSVVFMFSGQGTQYVNMCRELYMQEEIFREEMDKCFAIAGKLSDKCLKSVIFPENEDDSLGDINNTEFTQPLLFMVEYSLSRLLMHWGIKPDIMVGHSIGEYVAACVSGVFSLKDAIFLVLKRGELMQKAPVGDMLSISISETGLRSLLEKHKKVSLAVINSTELCVVSGTRKSINDFKKEIDKLGFKNKLVHTSHAFHSHMMEGIMDEYGGEVEKVRTEGIRIPFISNLTGQPVSGEDVSQTKYWIDHLRHTVDFSKGTEQLMKKQNVVFIEVGPGKSLSTFVRSNQSRKKGHSVVSLVRRPQETGHDQSYLLSGIGKLWELGIVPDWKAFYINESRRKVSLPTYSFEKVKYPVIVDATKMISEMISNGSETKHQDINNWFYAPSWKFARLSDRSNAINDKCTLIFGDACGVSDALITKYEQDRQKTVFVRIGENFEEHSSTSYTIDPSQESGYARLFSSLSANGLLPDCVVHAWGITKLGEVPFSKESIQLFFYSLVEIVKAFQDISGILDKQFVVLSSDLHVLPGQKENCSPVKSLAMAFLKVLSQEYPTVFTSHIDISLSTSKPADLTEDLYNEIGHKETGKVIALRNAIRYVQIFDKIRLNGKAPYGKGFKDEGVYLITGGLGAFGFNLTKHLLEKHKARVILTGRTILPTRTEWSQYLKSKTSDENIRKKLLRLQELEKGLGDVLYYSCDISDQRAVSHLLKIGEEKFGSLNGVIHAAGGTEGGAIKTINELDKSEFTKQFDPKIEGIQALGKVLPQKGLDFCLVTSSLSAVLGGLGFGAYAPANIFMDYYIRSLSQEGPLPNWVSVNLDGLTFGDRSAVHSIGSQEQYDVLERVLSLKDFPQIIVSVSDLGKRLEKWISRIDGPSPNFDESDGLSLNGDIGKMSFNLSTTSTEQALVKLWQDFFGKKELEAYDDFFEIGGDSLKALTMIGRIHKLFHVEIPVKDFFEKSSINKLAEYIDFVKQDKPGSKEDTQYLAIPKAPLKDHYAMSSAQKRLFFLYEFDKNSVAYNSTQVVRLEGILNKERLEGAFKKLIARHDSLRTSFHIRDGAHIQVIAEQVPFEIEYFESGEHNVPSVVKGFVRAFDVGLPLLLRVGLIKIASKEHILMVDLHHIITDGVSTGILINDFMALYNGEELPILNLQYKDYAEWQQSEQYRAKTAKQKDFWLRDFTNLPALLQLPTDHPRPKTKNYAGAHINGKISLEETGRLKQIAEVEKTTLFMTLLSVFNILLTKLSNQEDIVIGTDLAGRRHADLEKVIGMFIHTVAIRNYPKAELSFREFLNQVKTKTLACFENQGYQYEELVDDLNIDRNASRNPLFDVIFGLQNFEKSELELVDLTLRPYTNEKADAKFDITLIAEEVDQQIIFDFEYSTELFREETMKRFAGYFQRIISMVTKNVNIKIAEIPIMDDKERNQIFNSFNDTFSPLPVDETFVSQFEKQVEKTPDAIASHCDGQKITYRALNKRANQLSGYLTEHLDQKSNIPVLMESSLDLLITMLGIFKAGMVYVPININTPMARIVDNVKDLGARIVITKRRELQDLGIFYEALAYGTLVDHILFCEDEMPLNEDIALFKTFKMAARVVNNESEVLSDSFTFYDQKQRLTRDQLEERIVELKDLILRDNEQDESVTYALLLSNPIYKIIAVQSLRQLNIPFKILPLEQEINGKWGEDFSGLISENVFVHLTDTIFWESDALKTLILLDEYDTKSGKEDSFKGIWNQMAKETTDAINDYGWSNSYTGEAFTLEEMDEYVGNFKKKLKPYLNHNSRVLEIGCGHGIVLFELAPKVGYYHATDLAEKILLKNQKRLVHDNINNVVMEPYGASEINNIKKRNFDVVVCSSVVHYFPDSFYLENVIKDSISLIKGEGIIYLDDLINLDEKKNLEASTKQYKKENPDASVKTDWSNDLFVRDEFFYFLREKYPEIEEVEISRKTGAIKNELTNHRFDALLKINKNAPDIWKGNKRAKRRPTFKYAIIDQSFPEEVSIKPNTSSANHPLVTASILCIWGLNTYSDQNTGIQIAADDLSYIIYTSGTTGKPKGAMIHHGGMLNHLYAKMHDLFLQQQDCVAQSAPINFDISIWQFLACLLRGGRSYIINKDKLVEPRQLIEELDKGEVTIFESVPSLITAFLDGLPTNQGKLLPKLRWMIPTGEALSVGLVRKWHEYFPDIKLLNAYGPTEASDDVTHYIVEPPQEDQLIVPIGKPVQNTQIYILDDHLNLCPIGVRGEICVAGSGVGKGYWQDAEKTQKAFVPNPFATIAGAEEHKILYKTGDIGYYLEDGNIICLGRLDEQVKIRGNRIELGEIENALTGIDQIGEVAVIARKDEGESYLVAYYTSEEEIHDKVLRSHLFHSLPDYMIPTYFMQLAIFPLTANGKLNKKALPDPESRVVGIYVPASNEVEEKLQDIWAEILKMDKNTISINASFFELGGHSLRAMILVNKILKELEVEIPLKEIFERKNIKSISELIQRSEKFTYSSIQKASVKDSYAMSSAQKRLYFLYEFDKNSVAYNIPQVFELRGHIDVTRLEETFNHLIDRHESLRTSFRAINDEPIQQVVSKVDFQIEYYRGSEIKAPGIIQEFIRPFNLDNPPLIRVGLIKISDNHHLLMVDIHHIVADGTSMDILTRDFMALYNGENLTELRLQYKDYAEWQRQEAQKMEMKGQKEFWLKEFSEDMAAFELPTDFKRPMVKSHEGDRLSFDVDNGQANQLKQIAINEGSTPFMVILSVYNILLSKLGNQEDIVIGTPVAGRHHADLENIMGMLANTLPLRNHPKGELGFREFLGNLRDKTLLCFENQAYQYEELIDHLGLERDISRNPLFDVMFVYENFNEMELKIPGLSLEHYSKENPTSKFDLLLTCTEQKDGFRLVFEYYTKIFTPDSIKRFIRYFKYLVSQVISDPDVKISTLKLMEESELKETLKLFTKTQKTYNDHNTIHGLFEEQVERTPDNIALTYNGESLSYSQLSQKSNQLAHELRTKGISRNSVVGILMERSFEMVVSLMAILKAGGAYLPLDPTHPTERIKYMLKDSKLSVLLTDAKNMDQNDFQIDGLQCIVGQETKPELQQADKLLNINETSDLVYVIYTSGSTGQPKGVMINHSNMTNLLDFEQNETLIDFSSVLQFTTLSFDPSFVEIFSTLLKGGQVHLVDKEVVQDFPRLLKHIQENGIKTIYMPSSILNQIFNTEEYQEILPSTLKHIVSAGEQVIIGDLFRDYLQANQICLHNHYGPAETHVATAHTILPNKGIPVMPPIGRPIQNTSVYILDRYMQPQPINVTGEIFIGGKQVGDGYLGNLVLTSERFIDSPFTSGNRLYRTGDLARMRPDGNIDFLGRIDHQVKIHGIRVELGEIESALNTQSQIKESAVVVKEKEGEKYLVAYYVAEEEVQVSDLRSYLLDRLPAYMVPAYYVYLKVMPLTPTGKLHRKALPDPELKEDGQYVGPSNEIEIALVGIWSEVLKLDQEVISINKSFFELGGHSLNAMTLVNKMFKTFNVEFLLHEIFTKPTIKMMAENIDTITWLKEKPAKGSVNKIQVKI